MAETSWTKAAKSSAYGERMYIGVRDTGLKTAGVSEMPPALRAYPAPYLPIPSHNTGMPQAAVLAPPILTDGPPELRGRKH